MDNYSKGSEQRDNDEFNAEPSIKADVKKPPQKTLNQFGNPHNATSTNTGNSCQKTSPKLDFPYPIATFDRIVADFYIIVADFCKVFADIVKLIAYVLKFAAAFYYFIAACLMVIADTFISDTDIFLSIANINNVIC